LEVPVNLVLLEVLHRVDMVRLVQLDVMKWAVVKAQLVQLAAVKGQLGQMEWLVVKDRQVMPVTAERLRMVKVDKFAIIL
uniref:F-box domain-containing protein n=1 Tax=Anisakis simplex TaxID=6269 RepID=A0A0M3JIZ2_ANISI